MRALCLILFLSAALVAADTATSNNWPSYGGTHAALRYSSLSQINTTNVKQLAPAWIFQTGDYENGLQATPIVLDGIMYISTASSWVYALDAATGSVIWQYKYPLGPGPVPYSKQSRGVAVAHGRVFLGAADNHMVALDQKTGAELWNVTVQDMRQCGCSITGAPLVVKDIVITGVTGGDSAHRGYLTAFDVKTGRMRWRFYTIPLPGEKGSETWGGGDAWRFGGGSTWMTGSFDPDLNLLYWGVGNASSDLNPSKRKGDNLYTCSIIALDPDTGKLKWHYQEVPQDVWDYDAAFELYLTDLPVKGRTRKVVMQATKTGYVFMLDRATGEFLKAWPFAKQINWISGITEDGKLVNRLEPRVGETVFVCPSAIGAKNWNQGAFSPRTGWLYLPVQEICNDLTAQDEEIKEGSGSTGGSWTMKAPKDGKQEGYVAAYDPITGERKWTFPATTWILASILATAGDLIFTGDPEGNFFALDAKTGTRLWNFQTGAGHRGSAVTYSVAGRQYVATPTGWGSLVGASHQSLWSKTPPPRPGSTLVVFAVPEAKQ